MTLGVDGPLDSVPSLDGGRVTVVGNEPGRRTSVVQGPGSVLGNGSTSEEFRFRDETGARPKTGADVRVFTGRT